MGSDDRAGDASWSGGRSGKTAGKPANRLRTETALVLKIQIWKLHSVTLL